MRVVHNSLCVVICSVVLACGASELATPGHPTGGPDTAADTESQPDSSGPAATTDQTSTDHPSTPTPEETVLGPTPEEKAQAAAAIAFVRASSLRFQASQAMQGVAASTGVLPEIVEFLEIDTEHPDFPEVTLPGMGGGRSGLPPCMEVNADSVKFNNCDFGFAQLDGAIDCSSDTAAVDLDIDVTCGDVAASTSVDMTASASSLAGQVAVDVAGPDVSVNVAVKFDNISLDASFCPVSGSIEAKGSVTIDSNTKQFDKTVTFGPACGDVTVS